MQQFIKNHQADVLGVLSGFDRIRFRGTQRFLATEQGLMNFLWKVQVKLKEFKPYAMHLTREVRQRIEALAEKNGRPLTYLYSTAPSKENIARKIAREDGITEGLIGVLSCVEPCFSYEVGPNAKTKHLELRRRWLKCLHFYLYFIDPQFGFGHLRLQTWFPFTIHVCLNGREWLCRKLDRRGVGYVRRDNCVVAVDDVAQAQRILDAQVKIQWSSRLNRLAQWAFPLHRRLMKGEPMHYYWSADQTEWATDVMFRSSRRLATLYPHLIRHGMQTLSSADVMRFLGRRVPARGGVNGRFAGEVVSDMRKRPEGVRIKHRLNFNSIKMYDKQGSVLRVETTISHPHDMKVYRRAEGEAKTAKKAWRKLRKGVVDLPRRAQISQAANQRYLETLAAVEQTVPLGQLARRVCRPVTWQSRSVRGLRPLEPEDQALFAAVIRGEFAIKGFRNGDLRKLLSPQAKEGTEQKRCAAKITRQLRMLRAHKLIKKIPTTHRYLLTQSGRTTIVTFLAALNSNARKLNELAV